MIFADQRSMVKTIILKVKQDDRFEIYVDWVILDSLVTRSIYTFMYGIKSTVFRHLFRSIKSESTMDKNDENSSHFIDLVVNLHDNSSKIRSYLFINRSKIPFRLFWNFVVILVRVVFNRIITISIPMVE